MIRIIPRDLFNEGNLLYCWARLSLWVLDFNDPRVVVEYDPYRQFEVDQNPHTGEIFMVNMYLIIDGGEYEFARALNDKVRHNFYLITDDEEIAVFNEDYTITAEFRAVVERGLE